VPPDRVDDPDLALGDELRGPLLVLGLPPLPDDVLGRTAGGDLLAAIGRDGAGNACLNAIGYLEKWGYTGEQAYLILGTSPIEGRIGGVVDIPNACCSVFLPTGIVDGDIRPGGQGPQRRDRGQVCVTS
jgi:hypothetical protein